MADLTVITPVAPHHVHLLERAAASVQAQTAACLHLTIVDVSRHGPGYIRNRLLEQVTTPYVTFLDADDELHPLFAERTISAMQAGRYIFTDWMEAGTHRAAEVFGWGRGFHLVTAVVSADDARRIGGFDETLPGVEDRDFYLKLMNFGVCPNRLPEPLVTYTGDGQRSKNIADRARELKAKVDSRWDMGCCGNDDVKQPDGKRDGDVLAYMIGYGSRREQGRATGRLYRRPGGKTPIWVAPEDVVRSPQIFTLAYPELPQQTPLKAQAAPVAQGFAEFKQAMIDMGHARPAPPPLPDVEIKPNVAKVLRLAQKQYGIQRPVFAVPETQYPSYTDFRRLVELSGFELLTFDAVNWYDPAQTVIIVTPDDLPDVSDSLCRVIWWDLEWAYWNTPRPDVPGVDDVWVSDEGYAKRSNARFVLLGSHPDLNPDYRRVNPYTFDVTMLGYMVPRRQRMKQLMGELRWTEDYYDHGSAERHDMLTNTKLMLHVHQHEDIHAIAPLRVALAAAYRMPVLSEHVEVEGVYMRYVNFANYHDLPKAQQKRPPSGNRLYEWLCIENRFDKVVMEAIEETA